MVAELHDGITFSYETMRVETLILSTLGKIYSLNGFYFIPE